MNTNKKIVLAAAGGVLLLVFVFAAIMLFRGIRQFGVAEENLATARSQLDGFYKRKPFPSRENVGTTKSNVELMEGWMRDIVDVAKRKQVEPDATKSPSVFINMLAKVRNSLQSKAKQTGLVIDPKFGFGFDRYVKGEPATTDFVPRLIQQLMIVNGICNVLIDEKAKGIEAIEREQFDGVRGTAVRASRGGRTRTSRGSARSSRGAARSPASSIMRRASLIAPVTPDAMTGGFTDDSLDSSLKFVFTFSAKQESLLQILNRLARHEMFIVVTSVDIESQEPASVAGSAGSEKKTGRTQAPTLLPHGFGVTAADSPKVEKKPAFVSTPSRQERVVLGGKLEQPVKVRMELEVYRFK